MFISGCQSNFNITKIEEKIKSEVIGLEITYYNIAGNPIIHKVSDEDIKSIYPVELDNKNLWKVEIGEELKWNLYYDEKGEELIKTEQLFQT